MYLIYYLMAKEFLLHFYRDNRNVSSLVARVTRARHEGVRKSDIVGDA